MTTAQAADVSPAARLAWITESLKQSKGEIAGRWFAVDTRESVRDDTIRNALIPNGAIIERPDIPTTSPAPRYALSASFAALFHPDLHGLLLQLAIETWQQQNLNKGALTRIALRRKNTTASADGIVVTFPNRETRLLAPGKSSLIAKHVIEEFCPAFLGEPAVLWLSESRNKVIARDDQLAASIGLAIQADRNLPDIILVDLKPAHPLLVFLEVVATDGPVSRERKDALTQLCVAAGFPAEHVAFVTAYLDRGDTVFRKTLDKLAWNSFVWFASEPRSLIRLYEAGSEEVRTLSTWL